MRSELSIIQLIHHTSIFSSSTKVRQHFRITRVNMWKFFVDPRLLRQWSMAAVRNASRTRKILYVSLHIFFFFFISSRLQLKSMCVHVCCCCYLHTRWSSCTHTRTGSRTGWWGYEMYTTADRLHTDGHHTSRSVYWQDFVIAVVWISFGSVYLFHSEIRG